MSQCGIDYKKPHGGFNEHSVVYYVYGTAETTTDFELDFYGENQVVSIVIDNTAPLRDDLSFAIWLYD